MDEGQQLQQLPVDDLQADKPQKPLNCMEALQAYGERFGDKQQSGFGYFNHEAFPWGRTQSAIQQAHCKETVMAVLEQDLGLQEGTLKSEEPLTQSMIIKVVEEDADGGFQVDSDGEEVRLCKQCKLPLGDVQYLCMHTECRAQYMVKNMRETEDKRIATHREKQDKCHQDYGIGWSMESVPYNSAPAARLAMRDVPEGMVCLIHDETTGCIRIASTTEPAAATNLEYLSIALEVRRREGHEPIFSLDPVDTEKHSMQAKVFTPEWLAGTTAGEVLFQADYHLKELSMGEYEQPVVGMKSCFDLSEMEGPQKWSARQWFVVRKAEVQICDSDVLLPFVKMGVESREQVVEANHLVDKPLTRPDHPMVKYAEGFTQYFDLIAERKSVIYHLRELAKASVLAKYLLESHAQLEETWFHLASDKEFACSMEVPQLWHERRHALVSMSQAPACMSITGSQTQSSMHGVYGGVQFGLEKFNLSQHGRGTVAAGLQASRVPLGLQRLGRHSMVPAAAGLSMAPAVRGVSPLSLSPLSGVARVSPGIGMLSMRPGVTPAMQGMAAPITSLKAMAPSRFMAAARMPSAMGAIGVPRLAAIPPPMPGVPNLQAALSAGPAGRPGVLPPAGVIDDKDPLKGVDLRLDSFDLSSAKRVSLEAQCGSWGNLVQPLDECKSLGQAFWTSLECSSPFKETDQALLRNIFNPFLSDRRSEGDRFAPPDASYSHVSKLRALIKEEETVRHLRKQAFCKKEFICSEPGNLFPASWSSKLEVLRGRKTDASEGVPSVRPLSSLVERSEYQNQQTAEMLQNILKTTAPVFDKSTEDGMHFRVYSVGSLEVRSTQEHNGEEAVGVIFTIAGADVSSQKTPQKGQQVQPQDKITKVTEYVQHKFLAGVATGCCYYLVLETEKGHKVVTERLQDGRVTFQEDPKNLEDRNSLAKVTHTKECGKGATVRDIQKRAENASESAPMSATVCKLWARSTYARLVGKPKKEDDPVLAAKRKEKLGLLA